MGSFFNLGINNNANNFMVNKYRLGSCWKADIQVCRKDLQDTNAFDIYMLWEDRFLSKAKQKACSWKEYRLKTCEKYIQMRGSRKFLGVIK